MDNQNFNKFLDLWQKNFEIATNTAKFEPDALKDFYSMFDNVREYQRHNISKWQPEAEEVWQEGTTRILDFGGEGQAILLVPALINRANILDLNGDKSLVAFLTDAGYRVLLVDWQEPATEELEFDSDDYINRLAKFVESIDEELIYIGYCMGGLLSLKLAAKKPPKAMALLATPWNFDSPDVSKLSAHREQFEAMLDNFEMVPPEFIQSIFFQLDPTRLSQKYSSLDSLSPEKLEEFYEIENWVNNGVKMSVPMAKECLIGWCLDNSTGKGSWVDASKIEAPVFLGLPKNDKIVPVGCSVPLAGLIDNVEMQKFDCGHIGLITKKLIFNPLKEWLGGI